MITKQLISPKSIVVVGGSEDIHKPGGAILENLLSTRFLGNIYVVNPKASGEIRGCRTFLTIDGIPEVDLAILAIPAKLCVDVVENLCYKKNCGAIIIISAGFAEDGKEGAEYEHRIVAMANDVGAALIGPNCVGVITPAYTGVFTKPIPSLSPSGIDFVSGSGATIVFILELAIQLGLKFSSIFSIGNSAQIGVEDMLEYFDQSYVHGKSSPVKMLYIESINDPKKFLKHAYSLYRKGARVVAIKSGYSEAGSRAASSHTGAMASPDKAVSALFRKAGVIRCYSRTELVTTAAILMFNAVKGRKMAIITHAGGPAVMLTDVLSSNDIEIPNFEGAKAQALLNELYPGSSVSNPIDFLATGTAAQLGKIIDACENDFDVDSMAVIFGNPGLVSSDDAYDTILDKQKICKKPIFPILTSVVNAKDEIEQFKSKGGITFPEEVIFGSCFAKTVNIPEPIFCNEHPPVDKDKIRRIIDNSSNGYLSPEKTQEILDAAGINRVKELVVSTYPEAIEAAREIGWPLVMKVVGPVHKSDVGGVVLNICDDHTLEMEYKSMMRIDGCVGVLLQPMISGTQLFVGAKREDKFGHLVMCGLGGIYIEVLKDISYGISPISAVEAEEMIRHLRSYKLIEGVRGQEGVNEAIFNETIRRVSALCSCAPEIFEMDINPLMGNQKSVTAVDARIRIEK